MTHRSATALTLLLLHLAGWHANCNAARQNQRALDGGGGIVSYDDNGERSVMNDQQREELATNTQKVLASCK